MQDPGKPAEPVESVELIRTTVRHFLPDFNRRLARLADPRDENRWFYSVPHLTWLGLSMFLGGMESRYHLENCSDTPEFHKNLLALCGTQEDDLAHPDTLDYLLRLMQPDEFIGFQADCMRRLIRSKALDRFRLGNEFLVAVDGTGYRSFPRQHCPRCLHQKRPDGSSIWFHHVLEAKLITSAGMVFSLGSMLIENPAGKYEKQECELKTFYRFVPMLKALSAPYAHTGVRFVPTGGVTAENLGTWLALPAVAAAGGTWIAKKEDIAAGDWDGIAARCREAVAAAAAARGQG